MLYFARWKVILISLVILAGVLINIPNFLSSDTLKADWPSFLPSRQIVLGLDLQGGVYLLYEVDKQDYVSKRLKTLENEVRTALRQEPRVGYTGLGVNGQGVQVRVRDTAQVEEATKRLNELLNPLDQGVLGGTGVNEFAFSDKGDGLLRLDMTETGLTQRLSTVVAQSIEVIRRRVDEIGTTEPSIQKNGDDRILVEAPGEKDPERLKSLIGQTAQLSFHLVDSSMSAEEALRTRPPVGTEVLQSAEPGGPPYLVEEVPLLTGEDLKDARAAFDQQSNEPLVSFTLTTAGARTFADVTTRNVNRPFAIVLDNQVISAPVIREPITGGAGQISGNFTVESANDLAVLLRAGALPAKLEVVEERTVGPGLGADSIEAGKMASYIGAAAVVIFMIAGYGLLGVFANIALAINVMLIFATLTLLGATLTLPGIAGIVLTMGMAVDANVLIYERIREEQRGGRSAIPAIDAGFSRALGTIMDSNITTLIAAVILFQLGSGPVKGFAVTLAVGIFTSIFTAFTVTRLIIAIWVRRRRPAVVPI
ncbi:Protein translocase subunit Sec [Hartmannibacter diazotrophicus]|uniref:Protein translocase subunit SecD n=1 Tax=Hartmannibacter diazotrophicus TaxID=1482074 RepID=A0A2C9D5Z2_9HYPH|nr:protein translocase subunit SecD [Hartmannibacter diazotrophicus]SON55151.1 Protein translocase subunit Sec [Hartmannibacter diazotrophicus]